MTSELYTKYDKLIHVLISGLMTLATFGILAYLGMPKDWAAAVAWMPSTFLFYGREQSQAGSKMRKAGIVDPRMYLPWNWSQDGQEDFWFGTVLSVFISTVLFAGQ